MTELVWEGKYKDGKKVAPVRLALPFQDVETVNESAQTRNLMLDLWANNQPTEWRNRLIWGDKKYVLPSLLPEFAGKVKLVYIDPPFATGDNFSFDAKVPSDPAAAGSGVAAFVKEPSVIEQKAYRDLWSGDNNSYAKWFYDTVVVLAELLHSAGSIFVHCDWHQSHHIRCILDEVLGADNFVNELVWSYRTGGAGTKWSLPRKHDSIFWYAKGSDFKPNSKKERQYLEKAFMGSSIDDKGRHYVDTLLRDVLEGVVRIVEGSGRIREYNVRPVLNLSSERTDYPTQKPQGLLELLLDISTVENDLVLDCFCGSGTTPTVAEKLNRRWIAADLGRFAIHTTRKRLLSLNEPSVRPFVVQNLGKYERQAWQVAEFGHDQEKVALAQARYRKFILDLYSAEPLNGYNWLHGIKAGHFVHVGSVDAPVLLGDIKAIAREFYKAVGQGSGATTNSVDVLGWDFAFELNEMGKQMAADENIKMVFKRIPREVLERKAVEQGDIRFFELAALSTNVVPKGCNVCVELTDFIVSPDNVPEDVQKAITHWSQLIDYWAIDWDNQGDTFHNEWQSYRTKQQPKLDVVARHTYDGPSKYTVVIKVIDILGNDTTKSVVVEVV